ncbi:hypothetical protein UPYG_G00269220 [Umbra pygmaea]|uniref:C-type lectin domain-containing protein n=1 Tax=Umbra pygmaea TaxID=75934 RepID=A0ABD0WY58_UMBPY
MGKFTILLLLITAIVLGNANAELEEQEALMEAEDITPCSDGWTEINSRYFKYVSTPKTWLDSEKFCISLGGNLASVHSAGEYDAIRRLVSISAGGDPATWIGGTDSYQDRTWFWSDGTKFDYYNWNGGEPNNAGGREPCIQINSGAGHQWNDLTCGQTLPSVCSRRR